MEHGLIINSLISKKGYIWKYSEDNTSEGYFFCKGKKGGKQLKDLSNMKIHTYKSIKTGKIYNTNGKEITPERWVLELID